jgi:hypothetical protein
MYVCSSFGVQHGLAQQIRYKCLKNKFKIRKTNHMDLQDQHLQGRQSPGQQLHATEGTLPWQTVLERL